MDHCVEVRDVDDGAGPDVALADFDDLQLVSFQLDCQSVERLRNSGRLGDPVAEHRRPLLRLNLFRLVDVLHNRARRDDTCIGEGGQQVTRAVPVVGVAVRHIDGRQLLTRTCDELRQVGHVCANVLCIDQDGI